MSNRRGYVQHWLAERRSSVAWPTGRPAFGCSIETAASIHAISMESNAQRPFHAAHPGCVLSPAFHSIVDEYSVAFVVVDAQGMFIYCNSAAEALLGYDAATLTSRSIFDVVAAETPWVASEFEHLSIGRIWSGHVLLRKMLEGQVRVAVNAFSYHLPRGGAEFVATLRAVTADEPAIVRLEGPAPGSDLTARDISVLQLLAEGFADKEVASILGTSVWTINKDVGDVLRKLGAASRTEACIAAVRTRLIT